MKHAENTANSTTTGGTDWFLSPLLYKIFFLNTLNHCMKTKTYEQRTSLANTKFHGQYDDS